MEHPYFLILQPWRSSNQSPLTQFASKQTPESYINLPNKFNFSQINSKNPKNQLKAQTPIAKIVDYFFLQPPQPAVRS